MTRTVSIGSLSFESSGRRLGDTSWVLSSLDGWDDSGSGVRGERGERPQAHGNFDTPMFRTGRSIAVAGHVLCPTRSAAAAVVQRLSALGADGRELDITVTDPDLPSMSASVRIADKPIVAWQGGRTVGYAGEWWAADPLRYGDTVNAPTGFAVQAGGLEFDLFTDGTSHTGFLEFGQQGATGRVSVSNTGTAPTAPQFEITGPVPRFSVVHVQSGRRVSFAQAVAAGDRLLIDTATGVVVLNGGDVDYSGLLTRAEWAPIAPGETATFAFVADGPYDVGTLTVIARPAWW